MPFGMLHMLKGVKVLSLKLLPFHFISGDRRNVSSCKSSEWKTVCYKAKYTIDIYESRVCVWLEISLPSICSRSLLEIIF